MSKKREKEEVSLEEKLKMAIIPKEEEPYKVPDNWVWTRLGDITKVASGGTPSTSVEEYYKNGDIAWLSPKDLSGYTSKYISRGAKNITKKGLEKSSAVLLPKNTVLMSSRAPIGYVAISTGEISTNQGFKSFLPSTSYIPEYLYYYLIKSKLYLESIATGTTFKELSGEKAKKIIFPLPPIDEQKRIVNKLDYFFDKIQKVKEIIEEVKEKNEARKESILSKAFTGELTAKWRADNNYTDVDILLKNIEDEKQNLIKEKVIKRPPKMEPLTEKDFFLDIPKNWKYVKLNDIAFVTKLAGFEYTKNIYPNLVNKGIPLFKGKNVQNGKIVYEFESYIPEEISNELIRSQINKKCLLTPYVGTIGNVALFDGDFKAHLGSNVGKIELFNNFNQNILEEYMLYYFRSCYGLAQLKKHKKATAQESISIEAIRDCVVIIPPIEEQKEIVRILDNIFTKENLINELISLEDKIQALEKSILSKAFRGELGTNSKDDIEAMELLKEILQK